jgi:glycosyltransferase involved in cell wall biosynthesis
MQKPKKKPSVSVIIPVYKVEKYLQKCLDSVINQTLRDIEIVCINDASPDASMQILEEYAAKDRRVTLIVFEQNKGVATARNAGIDAAKGEYLSFIDSDDWVDADFLEKLYSAAKRENADIAKGCHRWADGRIMDNDEIKKDKACFIFNSTSAIYRTDFVRKNALRYADRLVRWEDTVFNFGAAVLANKVVCVDDAFLNRVNREGSATDDIPNDEHVKSIAKALEMLVDIANSGNLTQASYCYAMTRYFDAALSTSCKNTDAEMRRFAAQNAVKLFKQLKYDISHEFIRKRFPMADFLHDENLDGLIQYY